MLIAVVPSFSSVGLWLGFALGFLVALPALAEDGIIQIEGPALEGHVLLAVGTDGTKLQSADAERWQEQPITGRYYQPGPPPDQFEGFPGHDNTLYALAAEETGFVAVGNYGNVIIRTVDGQDWESLYEIDQIALCRDVAVGNGICLVVGWRNRGGNIVGKLDEQGAWQIVEIPETLREAAPVRSLVFGNGHFVLVSDDGVIAVTCDGEEWLKVNAPLGIIRDRFRVHHGGERFLLLGESLTLVSDDGKTWRTIELPGQIPSGRVPAAWTGKGFVVVNPEAAEVYWSTDAEQWERLEAAGDLPRQPALLAAGGALFGLDYGLRIVRSEDGTSWRTIYDGSAPGDFRLQLHDLTLGRLEASPEEPMPPLGALR